MPTEMPIDLISKARARRQLALDHMSTRHTRGAKSGLSRRFASLSATELAQSFALRQRYQSENIFCL